MPLPKMVDVVYKKCHRGELGYCQGRQSLRHRRVEASSTSITKRTRSIVSSMACRISTVASTLTCRSSGALPAASRLRSGHSFLPLSSRASCFWAQNDNIGRRRALLTSKNSITHHLQQPGVFGTSVRRYSDRKDGKDTTFQGLPGQKLEVGYISYTYAARGAVVCS